MKTTKIVYVISGPPGVGKSKVSRELVRKVKNYKLVEGDKYLIPLLDRNNLTWKEQIDLSWEKIAEECKKHLSSNHNVIIDSVIEDELEWLIDELAGFKTVIMPVVLVANKKTIQKRMYSRGSLGDFKRSIFLLEKFKKDKSKVKYLLDTTNKSVSEIVALVLRRKRFIEVPDKVY